ncbi:MAG TPA: PH domain-containing protein [Candidatus Saccharimonadales bacterium]|jgi:hypothetical protein|nr:PH domain-containing protein [Candidatus Saccharimonadales bacterium]
MDPNSQTRTNHHPAPQPVAYDQQGRPLYASQEQADQANVVYLSKPINPIEPQISPQIQALTDESKKKYPNLNLSPGEYIISAVNRHPIGILRAWIIALVLVVAFMGMYVMFFLGQSGQDILSGTDSSVIKSAGAIGLGILTLLAAGGAMIATYVYNGNKFYLTNESVIQEIQTSLFGKREQTVSLANIEDASYGQNGILQSLLNYGTIRLSTEGDETTYRFSYVSNPKKQIAALNNAVEAFKNGRPVDERYLRPHQDQPS